MVIVYSCVLFFDIEHMFFGLLSKEIFSDLVLRYIPLGSNYSCFCQFSKDITLTAPIKYTFVTCIYVATCGVNSGSKLCVS